MNSSFLKELFFCLFSLGFIFLFIFVRIYFSVHCSSSNFSGSVQIKRFDVLTD